MTMKGTAVGIQPEFERAAMQLKKGGSEFEIHGLFNWLWEDAEHKGAGLKEVTRVCVGRIPRCIIRPERSPCGETRFQDAFPEACGKGPDLPEARDGARI